MADQENQTATPEYYKGYNPDEHPQVWTEKFQRGEEKFRDSNRAGHEPCCICGHPVNMGSKTYLHVFIADSSLIPWDEVSDDPDTDYGDYIGDYSIGSHCAARLDPKYIRGGKYG